MGKFGRFLGISPQEIENIRRYFKGTWRDGIVLFTLRAIPIIPSAPISVVCGIIKIHLWTYLSSTLAGNFLRNFIYIYLGYTGISTYQSILSGLDSVESGMQIIIFIGLMGFVAWIYYKRHTRKPEPQ